jgi:hypothetical protein
VFHTGSIKKIAYDASVAIDSIAIGGSGARKIQLGKVTGGIQKSMARSGGISKAAHDIPARINAKRNRSNGPRRVELCKNLSSTSEGVLDARRVIE